MLEGWVLSLTSRTCACSSPSMCNCRLQWDGLAAAVHVLHLHGYLLLPLCGGIALVLLALQHPDGQSAQWPVAIVASFAALQAATNATRVQLTALNRTAGQSLLVGGIAAGLVEFLLLCAPLAASFADACAWVSGTTRDTAQRQGSGVTASSRSGRQVVASR
jgi:hypothetical protein